MTAVLSPVRPSTLTVEWGFTETQGPDICQALACPRAAREGDRADSFFGVEVHKAQKVGRFTHHINGADIVDFRLQGCAGLDTVLQVTCHLEEATTGSNDCGIRGTQVLLTAVDDAAHAFCHGRVLGTNDLNTGCHVLSALKTHVAATSAYCRP